MSTSRRTGRNPASVAKPRVITSSGRKPFEMLENRTLYSTVTFGGTSEPGSHNGMSVAALGANVVSGAPNTTVGAYANLGMVHIYDGTTGAVIRNLTVPSAGNGALFGCSVATTTDGLVLGGAYGAYSSLGAVYLFDPSTGALLATFNNPSHKTGDLFGSSVTQAGDNILIGAPYADNGIYSNDGAAYLFDRTGTLLAKYTSANPSNNAFFGISVAGFASGDVAVGASYDGSKALRNGRVYEYDGTFRGTTNAPTVTFTDPTVAADDHFGTSISASGTQLLIGADGNDVAGTNDGAAFLFDATTGTLTSSFYDPSPTTTDGFGHSVALSSTHVLVGAWCSDYGAANTGRAYVYDPTTSVLTSTINNPNSVSGANFGQSVALFGDSVIVSAPYSSLFGTNNGVVYKIDL